MVSTSAKKLINIATFISLFFHLILIFCLHCQSFLRISGFTKICNKKITSQCITFIVPEEGWFGQPKYSTHIKKFLRCTGFCLYFLHFIYVKPVRSPLIQRTPAGSSFRLLAQTFYSPDQCSAFPSKKTFQNEEDKHVMKMNGTKRKSF